MAKKGSKVPLLKECPRCQTEEWRQEELSMSGKSGFMGRTWIFWAFICKGCGYTEFYHKEIAGMLWK